MDPQRREMTFEVRSEQKFKSFSKENKKIIKCYLFLQVFGLDYMIDEEFKTWLIEVNTNPCLELSSPLLARIIPSMIENAFR